MTTFTRFSIWIVIGIPALFGGLFFALVQPGGSGVLAFLRLPDGSEYLVAQRCNWSAEPYTIGFYMRAAGGPWGWCYIDHEAMRWRDVALTHDLASDTVIVTKRGDRQATLDRKNSTFRLERTTHGVALQAPQAFRVPEFASR